MAKDDDEAKALTMSSDDLFAALANVPDGLPVLFVHDDTIFTISEVALIRSGKFVRLK